VRFWKLDSVATDVRHPRARSRITNNIRESLVGVDGRSERARRYRDILEALIVEYGSSDPDRIRALAALKLSLEATQAAVINGDILRSEDLVRLANLISRREKELRAKQRHREAKAPSLHEHLAKRMAAKAVGEAC
jgi:hypothetical protein